VEGSVEKQPNNPFEDQEYLEKMFNPLMRPNFHRAEQGISDLEKQTTRLRYQGNAGSFIETVVNTLASSIRILLYYGIDPQEAWDIVNQARVDGAVPDMEKLIEAANVAVASENWMDLS
jgi:endonuclease V-like protein UPF0215 family